ncbi:YhcN/YlaJ family sporulation lipoprotein [Paenibacillus sp. LHD-117]|uniref:YhcN/YlaJ family sporulation lipoprotein n=1 Tax=Paenibacillus sp. LHD-117 TaxID=3071412 RepID=UPI0027E010A7|nr:YhcN/YlaJ family sporulation lipoprotein [Paenibacillus sp. LHD-117]MDQ6418331.1 YhcN/YlaJ family sporulation lipoprotein [Paenibacillus sp. LHD-117]
MRNRNMWTILTASVVLGAMLGGCSMENQGDLGNKNIRTNQVRYDANGNLLPDKRFADDQKNEMNRVNGRRLNSNNLVGSHKNYRLEVKPEFGDKLTNEVEGIHNAVVMLADHNAYVAVSLDESVQQEGGVNSLSRTYMGLSGSKGVEAGRRMGALSTGQDKLTDELTAEITDAVKAMRPDIELVYVSANPDFVGRMNAYLNDSVQGYPVQHYIMEFNAMVERIFPPRTTKSSDELIRPYGHRFGGRLLE